MGFLKNRAEVCAAQKASISGLAIAMALAFSTPALASSDTGTLQGHVDGASAGTKVVAVDTQTGQRTSVSVDANGDYVILGLRPSSYRIVVEGRPDQEATLLVGETAVVDFVEPGSGGNEIVVTAQVRREVRTPSVSTNITQAQIESLPQNSRNFLSFAALAPGVTLSAPGGRTQLQTNGTSATSTNAFIDGLSIANPINHGGVSGQNFGDNAGNPFPQNAIQEYKIETANFGAETGQAGAAVLTAVTKSGGNEFHGGAFFEFQPKSFVEQPFFDKRNGAPKQDYNRKQYGGELGGPILQDKLFFYLAGERTNLTRPATTIFLSPVAGGDAANVISQIGSGPRQRNFKEGLYFGKLTYFASPDDTVNLSGYIRKEDNLTDIDGNGTESHGRRIITNEDRYQLSWKHSAGDIFNNFILAYDKSTQSTPSVGTGPEYIISNFNVNDPTNAANPSRRTDFGAHALLGANSFNQADRSETFTIKDDLTLLRGEHTIKLGGQALIYDLTRSVNDHINGSYLFFNPGAGGNFDPAVTPAVGARINLAPTPDYSAKDNIFSLYAQDEWKPDDHWTLNFGLRWDLETNGRNNNYVTPAAIAAALRSYAGWKAAGINPEDYISNGHNRKPQYTSFQPRIGFSYDVKGDRDLVIFGGAGRYYDRSLFIESAIEGLTNSGRVVDLDLGSTCSATPKPAYCTDAAALRSFAISQGLVGGQVWLLNNKTPLPFTDQFNFGVRKRFGGINTAITFIHQRSHNVFQFTRANFYENGFYTRFVTRDAAGNVTGCTNGGPNYIQDNIPGSLTNANGTPVPASICAAQNGVLPGFSGKLNVGRSDAKAFYTAVTLTAEKPFTETSTWGFTTALTISRSRTNSAAGGLNDDEVFASADQTGFGYGYVPGSETWRSVTSANYRAPYGFTLSGTLTLSSGPRFGSVNAPFFGSPPGTTPIVTPDGACCIANFLGSNSPKPFIAFKRLDLRVAKTFKLPFGGDHAVTFEFQALNVFNWLNRNYSAWGAGAVNGNSSPSLIENSQVDQDARAFKAGIKYKF